MNSIHKLTLPSDRDGIQHSLYIDISMILSISDAIFVNHMGHGGYFAQATIILQGRETPLTISVDQPYKLTDGKKTVPIVNENNVPIRVAELQLIMDSLRTNWEEYTEFRDRILRR
jgi:hypothetical protein